LDVPQLVKLQQELLRWQLSFATLFTM